METVKEYAIAAALYPLEAAFYGAVKIAAGLDMLHALGWGGSLLAVMLSASVLMYGQHLTGRGALWEGVSTYGTFRATRLLEAAIPAAAETFFGRLVGALLQLIGILMLVYNAKVILFLFVEYIARSGY